MRHFGFEAVFHLRLAYQRTVVFLHAVVVFEHLAAVAGNVHRLVGEIGITRVVENLDGFVAQIQGPLIVAVVEQGDALVVIVGSDFAEDIFQVVVAGLVEFFAAQSGVVSLVAPFGIQIFVFLVFGVRIGGSIADHAVDEASIVPCFGVIFGGFVLASLVDGCFSLVQVSSLEV